MKLIGGEGLLNAPHPTAGKEQDGVYMLFTDESSTLDYPFHMPPPDVFDSMSGRVDSLSYYASQTPQDFNQDLPPSLSPGECLICYSPIVTGWRHPSCTEHKFCEECIINYLELKITEAQVLTLRCPGAGCPHLLSDSQVSAVVPHLFAKYSKFKLYAQLSQDPSVRWCTVANCEGIMKGSDDKPQMTCPVCLRQQCFICGSDWHPKQSCDQIIETSYAGWAKDKEVQTCPNCRSRIEKTEGCNHITCSVCYHQWCWLCRQTYTRQHYNPMNPLGCPNLQSSDVSRSSYPMWRIYLMRLRILLFFLVCLVLSPLAIALAPSVFVTLRFWSKLRRQQACWKMVIRASFVFVFVLALTPLIYLVAVPIGAKTLLLRICR